ncbi:MAG TPA: PEP-CTERM sorting domain-containing protein [Gemmatimonas aurantiaca]|nr:PEP-CTERM sorting domain-containing protein [Gemmatimonas aurantiaca]
MNSAARMVGINSMSRFTEGTTPVRTLGRAFRYGIATLASALLATSASSQQSMPLSACTVGPLRNCATIDFSTQSVVDGTMLQIAINNMGSLTQPLMGTSIYNLVFATGATTLATPLDLMLSPTAQGSATITDNSPWSLFFGGDVLFLSALNDHGVGNCVPAGSSAGFGQAGNTCGGNDAFVFSFLSPIGLDLSTFSLLNMEVVGLGSAPFAESCGDPDMPCGSVPTSTVPEPATLVLVGAGLIGVMIRRGRIRS